MATSSSHTWHGGDSRLHRVRQGIACSPAAGQLPLLLSFAISLAAKKPTEEEVEAVRAKAAAAGFPSQTITEQQFEEMGGALVSCFLAQSAPSCTLNPKNSDPCRHAASLCPAVGPPAAALSDPQEADRNRKAAEAQEKAQALENIKKIEKVLQAVAAVPWLANHQARVGRGCCVAGTLLVPASPIAELPPAAAGQGEQGQGAAAHSPGAGHN